MCIANTVAHTLPCRHAILTSGDGASWMALLYPGGGTRGLRSLVTSQAN